MSDILQGKVAVITGAGRGIGRAIALSFAKAGADIAICARSSDALNEVAAQIEAMGQACFSKALNIADPEGVGHFCDDIISHFGKVDLLVNNAGAYQDRGAFVQSEPEEWWRTIEVNVRGPYLMTRHLITAMPEGAKIINMNSGKGYSAGQNSSSYHVSKAALKMFTEALANELWKQKIDVNTIIPGPTATTTLSQQDPNSGVTTKTILEKFTNEPPAGLPAWERVKHPDEVAALALQLASYPVGGPTGQVFSLARRPL
ncbi:MAG: SDR family NAD(P)-dependent oxidoreductase [Candidatus Puniceispirillaceae bacterium]